MKIIISTATLVAILAASITIVQAQTQQVETSQNNSLADFLERQNTSAKEYILSQFQEHDLVIICERDHKEFTQYELLRDVVSDPRFIEDVGVVFTEVGAVNMGERINEFLYSAQTDSIALRHAVTEIFREIHDTPYWHCYNFPWFLSEIQKINRELGNEEKIELWPSMWAFSWETIRSADDYRLYSERTGPQDSAMAAHIIDRFENIKRAGGKRKALVIMNYKHAFLKDHYDTVSGDVSNNTGAYLARRYGDAVASVYLMGLGIPRQGEYTVIKDGYWDYLFETSNKTDVGFDLVGTPFGDAEFDVIPRDPIRQHPRFEEMFTGLVFFKPVGEHRLITGWRGFTSPDFAEELRRRIAILSEVEDMGLSDDEINDVLYRNDREKEDRYWNLEQLQQMINQWSGKE
jgi:hypothetical protein